MGAREHVDHPSTTSIIDDFRSPTKWLRALDETQAASLIAAAADVTLVLDSEGIITDIAFGSDALSHEGYASWLGQPWVETVTGDSRGKVEAMIREADEDRSRRWRQVNHPTSRGDTVPIQYATVKMGSCGPVVALGRDLRSVATLQRRLVDAQQTMEREYSRLRHAETRYRLLFQVASEAVAIIDGDSGRIIEANPATAKLLGQPVNALAGQELAGMFGSNGRKAVREMLARVKPTGRTEDILVQSDRGGEQLRLSASMFRQDKSVFLLVRLSAKDRDPAAGPAGGLMSSLMAVVDSAPDGFVVTDLAGNILLSNEAFLELSQMPAQEQVIGESLARWLGRPGVDLNALLDSLREHGSVRLFATTLNGELGSVIDVEIAAVAVTSGTDQPCLGFTLRNVTPRIKPDRPETPLDLPRSVEQLTELVGRVPLKDLVRESTDMIEKLCISAALELTKDNRASAAEMLGLSRQSLYVKLRRYGLGDLDGE